MIGKIKNLFKKNKQEKDVVESRAPIQPLTEEELRKLIKKRDGFIGMRADFARLMDPRIFELGKEEVNNVRNLVIISGTISPFALLLLDKFTSNPSFLKIAITGFLLTVVLGILTLQRGISGGIEFYKKQLNDEIDLVDDFLNNIDDRMYGGKTKKEFERENVSLWRKIEKIRIRPQKKEDKKKDNTAALLSYLFGISIIILIASFYIKIG